MAFDNKEHSVYGVGFQQSEVACFSAPPEANGVNGVHPSQTSLGGWRSRELAQQPLPLGEKLLDARIEVAGLVPFFLKPGVEPASAIEEGLRLIEIPPGVVHMLRAYAAVNPDARPAVERIIRFRSDVAEEFVLLVIMGRGG